MKDSVAAGTSATTETSNKGKATVIISSDITGADIEIDGAFVGNTPSTRPLSAGSHTIKVSSGSKSWQRTVNIEADSSINLTAKLQTK